MKTAEVDTFSYLDSVVTSNGKIQNEINERIKKHHLVKGSLRNKDINEKCKPDIFNIYFKRVLLYGAETKTTKREDSKIQTMEMKFLRAILNKTKEDRIRNTT